MRPVFPAGLVRPARDPAGALPRPRPIGIGFLTGLGYNPPRGSMKHWFKKFRNCVIQGLVALLPLTLTLYILYLLSGIVLRMFGFSVVLLPPYVREILIMRYLAVGVTVLLLIGLVGLFGLAMRTILGRTFQALVDMTVTSIPGIKGLYSTVKQVIDLFATPSPGPRFSKTVLIEFPCPGRWALAFITGRCPPYLAPDADQEYYSVFMPSTPNPTTGFLIILPARDIRPTTLTVEEAIKLILSGGAVKSPHADAGPAAPVQPPRSQAIS